MRIFIIALIIMLAYILQSTLVQFMEVYNAVPNLMLMVVLSLALARGSAEGAVAGLFAGIVLDIFGARVFGLHSLLGMYTGLLCGLFNKRLFKENYFIALLSAFIFTFMYELLFYLLSYFLWGETRIFYSIEKIIIPEVIYTCIIMMPVYNIILRVNAWLEAKEKNAARKY